MGTKRELLVRLILLAAVFAMQLPAQVDRGVITGTVIDPSGAAVPRAVITVIQSGTNTSYRVTTSNVGDYTLAALPVGSYQLKVDVTGFKSSVTNNVIVTPGGETRLDVKLEVGSSQQTVEVTANAQTVQTENALVSTSVSKTLVDSLPVQVNGTSRSPFDLASATAGEVNAAGTFRIGGGNNTVGVTLDGSSITGDKIGSDAGNGGATAMNSPSVEALTEFTVESSGFKAETGHVSGGVLSFVSKSGSNQIHGSAFEYLRNQDFDAKTFFANANNSPKSIYKQNNFGVTVGGPVWIPKLYNGKSKTFFFGSYEGFRNRVGAPTGTFSSVPPTQFYSGDLSDWVNGSGVLYQIYDPKSQVQNANGTYTRPPIPNNQIPQGDIDPTAKKIAAYLSTILAPNRPGIVPGTFGYVNQNYIVNPNGTTITPNNRWSAKIDENLGTKHHLSYLMNRYRDDTECGAYGCTGLPAPIGSNGNGYNHTQVYRGNWDWSVTPTLMNAFSGGFNYFREDHGNTEGMTEGSPQSAGLTGLLPADFWSSKGICLPGFALCANMPNISYGSDFSGVGGVAANGSDRLVFELHDDMTKTKGAHTFKWGYFFGDSHYDGFGVQYGSGAAQFSYLGTSVPQAGSESSGGGSAFASFLLGQVNGFNLDTPRYLLAFYRTHQFYFQDDWKVSRKLTLNLGLRYEIDLAPISGNDRLSTLDYSLPNPVAGGILGATEFAGSCPSGCSGSRNLIANYYGGIAPRFGFAYAINDKTVIRGAATRSFGPVAGIGQSSHQQGYALRDTATNPSNVFPLYILNKGPGINLTVPNLDPGVGVGQSPPSYGFNGNSAARPDDELNYSFNIQRQITRTSTIEVGYLATLASDISSNFLADNQVRFNSLPATLSPFTATGRAALGSNITSTTAINAGAVLPWTCGAGSSSECESFTQVWGTGASVTQAYRPYPQYGTIDTLNGGGDRIGHSTYNALLVKFSKQLGNGLTIQSSYSFSKLLTDTDNAAGSFYGDMYNLRLLKSIASFDQTHQLKLTYVYELPLGRGKALLGNGGALAAIVGGWRISGIHSYASGLPMNIGTNAPSFNIGEFSNTPTISTYKGWTLPYSGKFQPFQESYLQPQTFFPTQSTTSFGNSTRYNPSFRSWPGKNESLGVSRIFSFKERAHLEFRGEAFNVFNRVAFGPLSGATALGNPNWGKWQSQVNSARVLQLVARMVW